MLSNKRFFFILLMSLFSYFKAYSIEAACEDGSIDATGVCTLIEFSDEVKIDSPPDIHSTSTTYKNYINNHAKDKNFVDPTISNDFSSVCKTLPEQIWDPGCHDADCFPITYVYTKGKTMNSKDGVYPAIQCCPDSMETNGCK